MFIEDWLSVYLGSVPRFFRVGLGFTLGLFRVG